MPHDATSALLAHTHPTVFYILLVYMHARLLNLILVAFYCMQVQIIHMKRVHGFYLFKINGGMLRTILGIPKMILKVSNQKWIKIQKHRYRSS